MPRSVKAVVLIGAATLVALGLAGASSAKQSHAQPVVRVSPNLRAGTFSLNWGGYVIQHDTPYTEVIGQWVVPTVTGCSANGHHATCYSSAWTGIDGWSSSDPSLIQTGTEQDYSTSHKGGQASYSAWWTTDSLGYAEQLITVSRPHGHKPGSDPCLTGGGYDTNGNCGTVAPGDSMTADVSFSSGTGTIDLTDTTQGWEFKTQTPYSGTGESAEWVMERPTVGGRLATLPNYDTFAFDPNSIPGLTTPGLQSTDASLMVANDGTTVIATPSAPDASADGFNMGYGSSVPNPPPSS